MSKKVVILYGGTSSERDVSCVTANSVAKAFDELEIDYQKMDLVNDWITELKLLKPTFAFLALHGGEGEDGTVQKILDNLNIPYNGSGAKASALAMDKSKAKKACVLNGVEVAKEVIYKPLTAPENFTETDMVLPVVVKPVCGGSSLGTTIVNTENDWLEALKNVEGHGDFMLEEFIAGREFTVGIMGEKLLAVTEITTANHNFYDYKAKYQTGGSQHIIPADILPKLTKRMMNDALKVVQALGCSGVSRVDFRYDEKSDRCILLEANTLPGLTPVSLIPEQAKYCGISFNDLILFMMNNAGYEKACYI